MDAPTNLDTYQKEELMQIANLFKILGEPNRLMLLEKIIEGYQCNCDLGEALSLAPNLVSHHLSVLCESGLVNSKRDENDGRWIFYSINEEKLNSINVLLARFFDESRIEPCLSCCGRQRGDK